MNSSETNNDSVGCEYEYRIRKLTPCECWNLQGFSTEDFLAAKTGSREKAKELLKLDPENHLEMMRAAEKINAVSNSQLYKQAGNSITVDTLYYIFLNLYKAMPYLFENLKVASFFSGIGAFEMALNRLYETINSDSAGGGYVSLGSSDSDVKPMHLGNWINPNYHKGYGGDVWDDNGISPSLMTMQGGARQPHVVDKLKKDE